MLCSHDLIVGSSPPELFVVAAGPPARFVVVLSPGTIMLLSDLRRFVNIVFFSLMRSSGGSMLYCVHPRYTLPSSGTAGSKSSAP